MDELFREVIQKAQEFKRVEKKRPKSVEAFSSLINSIDGDKVRDAKEICRSTNLHSFMRMNAKSPSEEEEDGDEWKKG